MTDLLNHRDLSAAIDAWAASIPNKPPLQRDPRLWELFEEDRRQYQTRAARGRKGGRPRRDDIPLVSVEDGGCSKCSRKMRPMRTTEAEYPNTVKLAAGGVCTGCYARPAQRGVE